MADALLILQEKYGKVEENYIIDINRESLATIAGTAKESLIRTLSDFKSENLIDIKKDGNIKILSKTRLRQLLN